MHYTTLISASELAQHLHAPDWVVLDCRYDLLQPSAGQEAYAVMHIPGAQHADLERDLSDKHSAPARGRHPLPTPERFIATLRAWGIHPDTQVVAYDAQGGMFAARLWWMLRRIGHAKVAVLDGGFPAWTASGLPVQTGSPEDLTRPPGNIDRRASLAPTVSAADLLNGLPGQKHVVIDARAPERFRGENETLDPVGGHIPGAKNRFFKDNLQQDGRFKEAGQLRAEFVALLDPSRPTVMQCGSGVTACHNLLAMEFAGLPGAALYPGSWSEWCRDIRRPIAVGEEPQGDN